jgi:hypothetical protein
MLTSTDGSCYYYREEDKTLYRLLNRVDSSTEGVNLIYLHIPFRIRLYLAVRGAIQFFRFVFSDYYSAEEI